MFKRVLFLLLFVSSLVGLFGCNGSQVIGELPRLDDGVDMLSLGELAERAGLDVGEVTSSFIKLRDSRNTVLVFTHSGGRYFVNGEAAGPVGAVDVEGGEYYFRSGLSADIESALRRHGRRDSDYIRKISGSVVLDPGHGGRDPGAIGCNGSYEKSVNLRVGRRVFELLGERGLEVVLTRANDRYVKLGERAAIANRRGAELFVSIHADSSHNSLARGYTVYVARSASRGSIAAARLISGKLRETGLASRGVRRANYRVLVGTRCPAVLVEMGFLSNRTEAGLLANEVFQERMARAISEGICEAMQVL